MLTIKLHAYLHIIILRNPTTCREASLTHTHTKKILNTTRLWVRLMIRNYLARAGEHGSIGRRQGDGPKGCRRSSTILSFKSPFLKVVNDLLLMFKVAWIRVCRCVSVCLCLLVAKLLFNTNMYVYSSIFQQLVSILTFQKRSYLLYNQSYF